MTEWAKGAADAIRAKQQAEIEKDKKFNEEQKLKREQGPQLWAEIKKWVTENCDSLNAEMESKILLYENTVSDSIRVQHLGTNDLLEANYKSDMFTLMWQIAQKASGRYILEVKEGKLGFFEGDMRRTVDFIGSQMLNHLLRQ